MLMAMIENIYDTMNIRVQETAFELHLRKIYPTRNILSFRETDTISGQMGLDVQKKTDGGVNIIRRGCNRSRSSMDDTSYKHQQSSQQDPRQQPSHPKAAH